MKKQRLDIYLIENGYFETRSRAKAEIMLGNIIVNDIKQDKAGTLIDITSKIYIKNSKIKYVSRGGLKLESAILNFKLDFSNKIILDIGSSTGGFTDCALQNGSKFVYSVDVGTNQLAWKLRKKEQVKSIENMHIKNLQCSDINDSNVDYIVMDLSFISLTKVLKYLKKFTNVETKIISLIKPQFEVGKEKVEKGGIIKKKKMHIFAINKVIENAKENFLNLENLIVSPIKGAKGNVEYLACFTYKNTKDKFELENFFEKFITIGEKNEK